MRDCATIVRSQFHDANQLIFRGQISKKKTVKSNLLLKITLKNSFYKMWIVEAG